MVLVAAVALMVVLVMVVQVWVVRVTTLAEVPILVVSIVVAAPGVCMAVMAPTTIPTLVGGGLLVAGVVVAPVGGAGPVICGADVVIVTGI